MRALLICIWDEHDEAANAALREFLASGWPVKPKVREDDDATLTIPDDSVDSLYQYVHDQTLLRVAVLSRKDAELGVAQYHPAGVVTGHDLQHALADHGYTDLSEQISARWRINFDWAIDDEPATTPQLLDWISDLAPPRQLTFESGEAQELADLFTSATCNGIRPRQLARRPDEFRG